MVEAIGESSGRTRSRREVEEFLSMADSDEASGILAVLSEVVHSLDQIVPPNMEVVVHDLSKLPNSIAAITGTVTGRSVGGPATDLLLKYLQRKPIQRKHVYETTLPDQRRLRSSTTLFTDSTGTPVAAFCVNIDVGAIDEVRRILQMWSGPDDAGAPAEESVAQPTESFPLDVDELASRVLTRAVEDAGIPVEYMKKSHKKAVVRRLVEDGFFTLRQGVEDAAGALGVTRFTIYNYLNELKAEGVG